MTLSDIHPVTRIDAVQGFHAQGPACVGRDRTIKIRTWIEGKRVRIHAWGSGLPENTVRWHGGYLNATEEVVRSWVGQLYGVWTEKAVNWQDPAAHAPTSQYDHPFADHLDLSKLSPGPVDDMWRTLAVAGARLFQNLFDGDPGLKKLAQLLSDVLWSGEQVITLLSDDLVIPWPMLYVPQDAWAPPSGMSSIDLDGFVGCRHLVEHVFESTVENKDEIASDIQVRGQVIAGAYYDPKLDERQRARSVPRQVVASALELLKHHADVREYTSKDNLESHLTEGAEGHLLYFFCHCISNGTGDARLMLGKEGIDSGELRSWLRNSGLPQRPFVVINACKVGRAHSHSLRDFTTLLLERGATCMVGPTIDIPVVFAAKYGEDLFQRILQRNSAERFGEAMLEVARSFATTERSPFGLTYLLFHGIDGHFCRWEESDAFAAA